MRDIDLSTALVWFALVALSSVLSVRWFRGPRGDATTAVVCTTLAALPSAMLLLELSYRGTTRDAHGYDLLSTKIAVLWILVGAPLLLAGFTLNAILGERPKHTTLVQVSHALLWLSSSLVSFWISMEGVLW